MKSLFYILRIFIIIFYIHGSHVCIEGEGF